MLKKSNSFVGGTSGDLEELNGGIETEGTVQSKSEKLTTEQLQQNDALIQVFSEETVTKLFSKRWVVKEEGLGQCELKLTNGDGNYTRETFRVSCNVAQKAISDKIAQVVQKGLNLLETNLRVHEA